MQKPNRHTKQHCREVIKACLNIVEERGDTYVAIHKDDDIECVVLVSMIRTQPILSVVVADKLLFAEGNEAAMYRTANELNCQSLTGWHTILVNETDSIYMYRQCIWMSDTLDYDQLMDILCDCISQYKYGKSHFASSQGC